MDNIGGNHHDGDISSSKTPTDKDEPLVSEELSDFDTTHQDSLPNFTPISGNNSDDDDVEREAANPIIIIALPAQTAIPKNSKKKSDPNSVKAKPCSRKGKKMPKTSTSTGGTGTSNEEEFVRITPVTRVSDDVPNADIRLSRVFKSEKIEVSEDRLSAGSVKGYRMVRSTRGVTQGAWYFEIKLVKLGETGHTRLGWCSDKAELEAPVGYDGNSYGYRDIDGCKIHMAMKDDYGGQGYGQGDVIGFYINLPEGDMYTPDEPRFVMYRGQKYAYARDPNQDPPKVIPGSEISFFKNGKCQGVAFKDLFGGRYYAAASMFTLPDQPNCVVRFNFGPDFESFPQDFNDRPLPRPMIEVPYHGFDSSYENGVSGKPLATAPRKFPVLKLVKEQESKIAED